MPNLNETLAELNLSANPFVPDTPLESLFPGGMRRASLDQLQLLARESSDIIALIGPDGAGKTLLADFFARRAERDQIVARTRASMLTSPSQLLQEMFKAFVLDFPAQASIAQLKQVLAQYFHAVQNQSRSIVLIVDDAHELGDDAFSLLTKLALSENAGGTFHLILVGQVSLLDMLDYTCPQKEGQNQFTSIRLPEFNLDETRNYLRYRLNAVGFNDLDPARALPFSNRQVEKIQKLSAGVPAAINQIAGDMLFSRGNRLAWLGSLPQLASVGIPRNYAYAAGVLVLILIVSFLFGGDDRPVETAQRQITLPSPVPQAISVVTPEALPEDEEIPLSSPFASDDTAPDSSSDAVEVAATPTPTPNTLASSQANPVSATTSTSDATSAPSSIAAAPTAPVVTSEPAPRTATPAASPVTQTASANPASRTAAVSAPSVNSLSDQRARIMGFPANQYTVQLLGAASRANVEAFVQRNSGSPLYWFETQNQGRPWYVVIHGNYPSRAAAQSAASALSGELGRLQPWIRSVGAVQNDMQANN